MLMSKVLASPSGTLLYPSHHFPSLVMPLGLPLSAGETTLCFGKSFLLRLEEARILNLLLTGESSKSFQSDGNANLLGILRQGFRFTFSCEASIPFARGTT